jgi:hypothetical protein
VVPLDHGEVLFPGSQGQGEDGVGPAGPAMQDQQDRVVAVFAPDLDPLVDPTHLDEALLDDPSLRTRPGETSAPARPS